MTQPASMSACIWLCVAGQHQACTVAHLDGQLLLHFFQQLKAGILTPTASLKPADSFLGRWKCWGTRLSASTFERCWLSAVNV
jgi:hypothetical protein